MANEEEDDINLDDINMEDFEDEKPAPDDEIIPDAPPKQEADEPREDQPPKVVVDEPVVEE